MNKKIVKVSIYNSSCTPSEIMQGNGDAILDNICISAETDENLETGEYYLDAIFLVDNEGLWKHIQEESILKVQMDYGEEYFRIAKIQSTSRDITVFARQETMYQTLHMWLTDVRPENRNGQSALTHIKDNCIGAKNINVLSDISKLSTAYYQDMNVYEAIHTCDQSFLNRWGGEVQRRGYNLTINQRLGTHRGVQIRSKKNLTGFEANVDMDNVFTRIKPKGFDGITIDGFVDSPLINNYPFIKTTEKKYEDVKVKDPTKEDDEGFNTLEEAQAELIKLSELEFSQNNIDKIKAYYNVNFIQLEQTEEYKNYVQAERIFLGDEVDVYEETLNINITVRAMRRQYDVLRQRVIEVELSNEVTKNKPPTIGDILDNLDKLEDEMKENNDWYKDAVNNATDLIQNGLKDSYVVVRKNEILVMDTTDINTAMNVWRWNKGGLGFSSTGYYGEFETAITMDGSIVGKFITGLIIKGNQINARELRVVRDDGTLTMEITTNGDVNLNVTNLKIQNEGVATKSELTQTSENLKATFNGNSAFNLLRDTRFINKDVRQWNYWGGAETWHNKEDFADGYLAWGVPADNEGGMWQDEIKVEPNTQYTLSTICSWQSNCRGVDFVIEYSLPNGSIQSQYIQIQNLWWTRQSTSFITPDGVELCKVGFRYKGSVAGSIDYLCVLKEPCLSKGTINTWSPYPDEIVDGIITLDRSGITIDQGQNSCVMSSQAIDFFSSGTHYSRIEGGKFMLTDHYGNMIGEVGRTEWNNGSFYNGLTAVAGQTAGISTQLIPYDRYYVNLLASSYAGVINDNWYVEQGLNLISPYIHQQMYFRPYDTNKYGDAGMCHIIYDYGKSHGLGIVGSNEVVLGVIAPDGSHYAGFYVTKDMYAAGGTTMRLNGQLDCGGYPIINSNIQSSLSAQTKYTRQLKDNKSLECNTYGAMTFTQNEIRYVERETMITYKEYDNNISTDRCICYCELPIFMAENIEKDYHINISKISFGDYRIIEKTSYYFILESEKEGFSFTYEVVAKQIEGQDNNAVIANNNISIIENKDDEIEGYIAS